MTVSTWAQPNFTVDDPTTYRGKLDGNSAVAAPIVDNFGPHAVATPNMTVQLDAGAISGIGALPTQVTLQTSATLVAPTTNPRKDIVYIDAITGVIGVATGTEAVSPIDPAIPSGKIPIARLAMTVGMASVTNSIITDLRAPAMAVSSGGSVTAISTNTTLTIGQNGTTFSLTGTTVTVTLPTPAGNAGVRYRFVGSDANTQTIATSANSIIAPDGTPGSLTITDNQEVEVISDGSNWRVIGMAGKIIAQSPAANDNTTKVATTAMVQAAIAASVSSSLPTIQTFSTPGAATWTKPVGVKTIRVRGVAGGAGGGAGNNSNGTGPGGGAGGGFELWLDVTSISSVALTIGGGGVGGVPANGLGTDGGATNFGAYASATGGKAATSNATSPGGFAGVGTGGMINHGGGHGQIANNSNLSGGGGGPSFLGSGGPGASGTGTGTAGTAGGGGGGGGSAGSGGAGGNGLIIVEQYTA